MGRSSLLASSDMTKPLGLSLTHGYFSRSTDLARRLVWMRHMVVAEVFQGHISLKMQLFATWYMAEHYRGNQLG